MYKNGINLHAMKWDLSVSKTWMSYVLVKFITAIFPINAYVVKYWNINQKETTVTYLKLMKIYNLVVK